LHGCAIGVPDGREAPRAFVEAGVQAGQADLKVGLYTNTSEFRA
jgi:hypothetical protein